MLKGFKLKTLKMILIVYVLLTIFFTVIARESQEDHILLEWLWGYKSSDPKILYRENIFNILLFVPLGLLVGLVVKRYNLIKAVLVGLFVSETIECSQLI